MEIWVEQRDIDAVTWFIPTNPFLIRVLNGPSLRPCSGSVDKRVLYKYPRQLLDQLHATP